MSVKAVTLSGEKWFIGGAPRSKNVGEVLMLRHGDRGSGYLNLNRANVLTGQQFGSGFGYDLAVDDFNLDKFVYRPAAAAAAATTAISLAHSYLIW